MVRIDESELKLGAGGLGCEILKDLALSGFKDIHVIDCLGKAFDNLSLTETFKGFNMDISGLAKGMYFVRLNFEDKIITKKLLIE